MGDLYFEQYFAKALPKEMPDSLTCLACFFTSCCSGFLRLNKRDNYLVLIVRTVLVNIFKLSYKVGTIS